VQWRKSWYFSGMKKLHVTDLTDGEFSAVFKAAAREAVTRAAAASKPVPSISWLPQPDQDTDTKPVKAFGKARKKAVA
jgi:hypothetical protein